MEANPSFLDKIYLIMSEDLDARRKQLKLLNSRAWGGEVVFETSSKLDSSLKKNTAFIKKVKTAINNDQYKTVLKDIETLSLEKYISEITLSISEGLLKITKNDDIVAAIEIISALHQRFSSSFSPLLLSNFVIGLSCPTRSSYESHTDREKDDQATISKQKVLIRLLMELYLIGVFRTIRDCDKDLIPDSIARKYTKNSNDAIIIAVLKVILNFELQQGYSIPIVQTFLKRFHHLLYKEDKYDLLDPAVLDTLKQVFELYTKAVFSQLVKLNKERNYIMYNNRKASIRTGRILEENVEKYESINKVFGKFKSGTEFLSQTLDVPVPKLNDHKFEVDENGSTIEVVRGKSGNEDEFKVWEDIKDKNFYTIIPTVDEIVEEYKSTSRDDSQSDSDGSKVNEFLARLGGVLNEKDVDILVFEFHSLNLNNKATKNRLLKYFIEHPTIDNLKFFARFFKINHESLNDVIGELIDYLDKGFRSQINRNTLNMKNISFFVEFIKFKLIPTHIIFHKIRRLTMNISETNNIDILSVVYEKCGRFLLNEPEYRDLMLEMLDLLKEKLKDGKLSINDKFGIKNLLYIIDPPETKVADLARSTKRVLSEKEQFIEQLLKFNLNKESYPTILNILKKINWAEDIECQKMFLEITSKPELITYENIEYMVKTLHELSKIEANDFLLIRTIDSIVENIIRGLQLNDYRLNRLRISQIKFIGHLYNIRVLNFRFVTDVLYKIVCLGHANNQPLPMNFSIAIDLPNNYFRIQLCCILLCSLDSLLIDPTSRRSGRKRKLTGTKLRAIERKNENNKESFKVFMVFFQYYLFCKAQPIPIEIEFKISEVFNKYSVDFDDGEINRFDNLGSVIKELQVIVQKRGLESKAEEDDEDEDEYEEDVEDDEEEKEDTVTIGDLNDSSDLDDSVSSSDSENATESEDENGDDSDAEDIKLSDFVKNSSSNDNKNGDEEDDDEDEVDDEDDDNTEFEFKEKENDESKFAKTIDIEYRRMVSESMETNRYQNTSNAKVNNRKSFMPLPTQMQVANKDTLTNGKMTFSLLTKRGKDTKVKQVDLPSSDKFAENLLHERENRRTNRERTMQLARNMNDT